MVPMAEPSTPEPGGPGPGSAEPGLTITRVFDAPRDRVWREWTEPAAFADWFGGAGAEVPIATVSMDVREGGRWRATMFAGPGPSEIRWTGHYREVIEPERLVLTINDTDDEDAYELVVVVLADLGDGRTEMRLEQYGHMAAAAYEAAGKGWGAFFDAMDVRLAAG
jgi:uncharacterized protein YndB with AHSA1/START domain